MDKTSKLIMTIREAAGGGGPFCPLCRGARHLPHRRKNDSGYIVEGCVDASHSGHVHGEDLRWHNRPEAKAIRKRELDRFRSLEEVR